MHQIQSIAVIVGIIGLGFYGKPDLESLHQTSLQIHSENPIQSITKAGTTSFSDQSTGFHKDNSRSAYLMNQSLDNSRQEIQNHYNKIATSFIQKDSTVYLGYLIPTFVEINKDRKAGIEQVRENHEQMIKQADFVQVQITIQKLDLDKDLKIASALVKKYANGLMQNHKIVSESSSQDLWVKNNQGWQLKQSRNTLQRITLDGIKMPVN